MSPLKVQDAQLSPLSVLKKSPLNEAAVLTLATILSELGMYAICDTATGAT